MLLLPNIPLLYFANEIAEASPLLRNPAHVGQ
jgi:hypothetical protein